MTEFWKSNERHYCTVCNCWLDSGKVAIRRHEEGKGHKENFIKQQKSLRQAKSSAANAAAKEESEWAKIDAAAQKAYEADVLASGGARTAHIAPPIATTPTAESSRPVGVMAGGAIRPGHSLDKSEDIKSYSQPLAKPAAADKKAKSSPWVATVDPATGATYYYNIVTLATTWTKPEEESAKDEGKEKKEKNAGRKHPRDEEGKNGETEGADGEEGKKKQKLADLTPAEPTPIDIDEDTGFGKWSTVAPVAEPEESQPQPKKRMTPWGLVKVDAPEKPATAAAAKNPDGSDKPGPPVPNRYANLAGDDDADADEDAGGPVDLAQQLRNQFGPSAIIHSKASTYEAGADLLADDSNTAPVVVSFKKKSNRSTRQPTAATND